MPNSPRIKFPLLTGGSDYPTPDDPADAKDINDGLLALEAEVGVKRVTSGTRPSAPYTGQLIFETDTDLLFHWNGSAWERTPAAEPGPVWARAVASADQNIPNDVATKAAFGNSNGSGITYASNEYTIVTAGRYIITGNSRWQTSGAGFRLIELRVGATAIARTGYQPPSTIESGGSVTTAPYQLAVGDKVSMWVQHNVGSTIELRGASLGLHKVV